MRLKKHPQLHLGGCVGFCARAQFNQSEVLEGAQERYKV